MMIPNPFAIARLKRGPVEVVPDPVEPDPVGIRLVEPDVEWRSASKTVYATTTPAPRTVRPCGHCNHPQAGHGRQYGALVGWHDWWPEAPSPNWMRTALNREADQ